MQSEVILGVYRTVAEYTAPKCFVYKLQSSL